MSKKFELCISKDKFLKNLLPKSNAGITQFGRLSVQSTNGFKKQFKEEENIDEKLEYNSLLNVEKHEENIMRTNYLVRDVWNKKQIIELRDFINEEIENKEANDE